MKTNSLRILLYLFVLFLAACHPNQVLNHELDMARTVVEEQPDTALCILQRIQEPQKLSDKEYATYCLLRTQAEDNSHIPHTSDSVIRIAVDYFRESNELQPASQSFFYLARVNEGMGKDTLAEQNYLTALSIIKNTKDYQQISLVYNQLSELYRRLGKFDEAFDMQGLAYDNNLLAKEEKANPLPFYLIISALALVSISLIFVYRSNLRYVNEEKKNGKLKRQLNAAQQTAADQRMEIIALKKDVSSMQRSLYNCTDVIVKIRGFNERNYSPKEKPSLSEQEWHIYFNLLEDAFEFTSRLKQAYPKLTDDDLRICALLKEGVSALHIGTILNILPEVLARNIQSIKSDKMGLNDKKTSLETIIKSF